jgi:type VI secretion system secreted protein Hcp
MSKISFIKAMTAFMLVGIAICVIGGDLNPGNTPSPTMRTLDELYKNIQPGLPSDWKPFPTHTQCETGGAINMTVTSQQQGNIPGSCTTQGKEDTIIVVGLGHEVTVTDPWGGGGATPAAETGLYYVTKYIDKSSPKLYRALCEGDRLTTVELKFYRTDPTGQEEHYYTLRLQDSMIASIRTAFPNIEEIAFSTRRIYWIWTDGPIQYDYNFAAPH